MNNKVLHMVAYILLFVGGLNWGLVGLFNVDLVDLIFGGSSILAKLVYILVGASAVFLAVTHRSYCKYCGTK
ncbi:MAG: DUF378 domain-containing protein [Candidatus Levybacteria bacterium]|nr:DUF378 domain-containing protein [Candidatus Levybacteria bacterium]